MSRHERTGWRDGGLSARHRLWGRNLPAVDIDLLLVEFDLCEPRALIEYKHEKAAPIPVENPNLRAISRLAGLAGLPAFVVRYGDDLSWFRVRSLNGRAKRLTPRTTTMTEDEYVAFLYGFRDRKPPRQGRRSDPLGASSRRLASSRAPR